MSGSLTVNGTQTGAPSSPSGRALGSFNIPMGVCDETADVFLASGANTVTVPAASVGAVLVPPAAGVETLILKGVTGDTGVPISAVNPTVLTWDAAPASFCLTSSTAVATTPLVVAFF